MQIDWKQSLKAVGKWVWAWVWWAFEQFAVLFLNGTERENKDTGVTEPCATCWWYRGVLLGFFLGFIFRWWL